MKIKHLLLLLLMFVGISAKAQNWTWVGETPAAGNQYYLYSVNQQKFLNDNDGLDVTPSVLWTLGGTFPGNTNNTSWCTLTSAAGRQLSMSNSGSTLILHTNSTGLDGDQVHFAFNLKDDKYAITRTTKMTYKEKIIGIEYTREVQRNIKSTTTFLINDKDPSYEWLFILEAQVEANINYVEAWYTANAYRDNKFIPADLKNSLITALEKSANVNNAIDIIEELNTVANDCKTYLESVSPTNPINATGFIVNPSFETGNFDGWTNNDNILVNADNNNFSMKDGNHYAEVWWWDNSVGLSQTIGNLPNGEYELSVDALSDGTNDIVLFAGNNEIKLGNVGTYSVKTIVTDGNPFAIGVRGEHKHAQWFAIDNFRLTYLGASATMTVNAEAKYGTFCAPFAVEIPAGVKAYTVDDVDANALVMNEVTTTIPANTPVVLNAEDGLAAKTFYGIAENTTSTVTVGLLTGVYTQTYAPKDSYILANHNGQVGFYHVKADDQTKVGANRAYLTVTEGTQAPAFYFDTETAIETVEALTQGEAVIYDINGVKQQSLQKGINIVKMANGKTQKVLVK